MESVYPAGLLRILLLMAGIEPNPGPTVWYCAVCNQLLKKNQASVRCNSCQEWSHLRSCSGLQFCSQWNKNFISKCCLRTNQNSSQPNRQSNQSLTQLVPKTPLVILQLNCNSIRFKINEIVNYMSKRDVKIAAIQETKLDNSIDIDVPGYYLMRCDRNTHGGGLAFIIHNDVQYHSMQNLPPVSANDQTFEQLGITVTMGTDVLHLVNVYIPPVSSCPSGYIADISHLLELNDCIILGDMNAHHNSWDTYVPENTRGYDFVDQVDISNFGFLNDSSPTRSTSQCISAPDLTLVSSELLHCTDWSVDPSLGSDHLPILVSVSRHLNIEKDKSKHSSYMNFVKANRDGFREYIETKIEKVPPPRKIHVAEKTLRGIVNKAAHRFIPAGKH